MEETIVNGQIRSRSIYLDDDNYLVIMLRIQEQGYETPYFVRYGSGYEKIYVAMLRSLLQVVGAQSFDDLYGKSSLLEISLTNTGSDLKIFKIKMPPGDSV